MSKWITQKHVFDVKFDSSTLGIQRIFNLSVGKKAGVGKYPIEMNGNWYELGGCICCNKCTLRNDDWNVGDTPFGVTTKIDKKKCTLPFFNAKTNCFLFVQLQLKTRFVNFHKQIFTWSLKTDTNRFHKTKDQFNELMNFHL